MRVTRQAPIDPIARRSRLPAAGAALLAAGLALAVWLGLGSGLDPARAQAGAKAPQAPANVVVLLTDDQETASIRVMKILRKEMKRKGMTMRRAYAQFPLCCPSRATMLTGQFAHNHQVLSNSAPDGGYGVFNELHGQNYLPMWLQDAGYTTGFIGKYLNEYAEPDPYGTVPSDVPLGWDEWYALAPSRAQYFDYTLNQNGNLRDYGHAEDVYSTDRFTLKAKRFIRHNARSSDPFFLMLGYAAPHGGGGGEPGRSCNRAAVPAPRHLRRLKDKRKGQLPASFNEADISDKPTPVSKIPPLTEGQVRDVLRKRRCAWESLLAVDESVGTIVDELKRAGERRNTYVFFLSDNGILRGEHRIRNQKRYLYEDSARIPMIVRGPGIPRGRSSEDVVSNADIVPTILEISGASPGLAQDGESLLPALANPDLERGRPLLLEAFAGSPIVGIRNTRYLYTEWSTGEGLERELYDTFSDRDELNNLIGDPRYATVAARLADQLDSLRDCTGAGCHPEPSGRLDLTSGGAGPNGCQLPPVVARLSSASETEIAAVSFFIKATHVGDDLEPPFEVELPYERLQKPLPRQATVIASALFEDGRRRALPAKLRACRS